MVLAVEPNILNEHGYFQLEEDVVVTETGCEVLTNPAPPDLWIP
jgi:Xaa-Pro aminopeptidase